MTPRTIFTHIFFVALVAASSRAYAESDAADDASVAADAGPTDEDGSTGDAEEPTGLQPTVFDSNLGCSVNRGRGPSALPLVMAIVALGVVWRTARSRERRRT